MQFLYRITADAIVVVHMTYVLIVVLGLPATWIGILRRQSWARNFWWRIGHLTMILIVVMESWAGIECPLTTWESHLRELSKEQSYQGAFVANFVHNWLFIEAPRWAFTVAYTLFGLLVVLSFILGPPKWPQSRRSANLTS